MNRGYRDSRELVVRLRINVAGMVQGVGFRPFVYRLAVKNRLKGYVKNRGDAGVEILLEGDEQAVSSFMRDLKTERPPMAQLYQITTTELDGTEQYSEFVISESSNDTEFSGSTIPPDVAICDDCLAELRNPKNPRFEYFFITCTNCGPRYTIIEKLPYDRVNTTMREFTMCSFCLGEYTDPTNRRFHAQTVASSECGPKAYLVDPTGAVIPQKDPIRQAGKLLSSGKILAIKGYGGFHIAASILKDEPLLRLRKAKLRSQKPFAVMARSIEAIKTFAELSKSEEITLKSPMRPIVLLNKKNEYDLSDNVAPGLHNIGVMLPYTGLHYLLFDQVDDPAFVMTSANPPNQPIINENGRALDVLGETVDFFLFHDRQIAQRCDDSVIRKHGSNSVFLRRSRGYAPAPLILRRRADLCAAGLGGDLNNTACVLNRDKAFMTQHIGDTENVETRSFLESALRHLIGLTNSDVDIVTCDLHPKFTSTSLANDLAKQNDWKIIQVQHHHAHIAGLLAENGEDEAVGICCDGYGYGLDGQAWGGEILLCSHNSLDFKRLGHLERQALLGGDLATRFPMRMAATILKDVDGVEEWLMENKKHFPHGEQEIATVLDQLDRHSNVITTTSCGRVLDAVSAVLGICFERTYEGEPSMKLESAAINGKDVLKLEPMIEGDTLRTTEMLRTVYENRERLSTGDLAYSAQCYLAKGLASLAIDKASEHDVNVVGFSGGVACNQIISSIMREIVERNGLKFLVNQAVPPGDGGLSFGQAVVAGFS